MLTLTSEIYPTSLRTKGVGFVQFLGRVGSFLTSYIVFSLFKIETFLPFFSFAITNIIGSILVYFMIKDTANKVLDARVIIFKQNSSSEITNISI
jgi:hypothetical protein